MDKNILQALNKERKARRAAIVLKDLETGKAELIVEKQDLGATFDNQSAELIAASFHDGKSRVIETAGREQFINVYLPPIRLVVIGAVHISQYLASIARETGFDLEIIDPRTAFATEERFKGVEMSADWPQSVLAQNPLDNYCALIALTHDPKIDDFAIVSGLEAGCFYIGALGSRKTHAKRLERLASEGVGEEQLARIQAPIGMDIRAANPAEIAVAILAQVISSFRRRGS